MFAPLDGLSGADAGRPVPWTVSEADTDAEGGQAGTGAAEAESGTQGDGGASAPETGARAQDAGGEGDAGDEGAPLAPIAFVQVAAATPTGVVSSVSATYEQPQSAGDLNVVAIGWNDNTGDVADVSDTSGNVYQLAVGPTRISPDLTQAIYYAKNIGAAGAATDVVTVTFVNTANVTDLRVAEYSGLDPVAPFDVASAASGNDAGPAASGMVSTTAGRSLLFGAGMTTNVFSGPGPGYTLRLVTAEGDLVEDMIVSSAGSYDAEASLATSCEWILQIAAFH